MRKITQSEAETTQWGKQLASRLQPGDVVLLTGELGAGKSVFARGVARGLGIQGAIPSPTFTILQQYDQGRIPLYHFDLYRLEDTDALYALGLEEYLGGNGIALVEWPQRCAEAMPERRLEITIAYGETETERIFTCTPVGGFPRRALEEA